MVLEYNFNDCKKIRHAWYDHVSELSSDAIRLGPTQVSATFPSIHDLENLFEEKYNGRWHNMSFAFNSEEDAAAFFHYDENRIHYDESEHLRDKWYELQCEIIGNQIPSPLTEKIIEPIFEKKYNGKWIGKKTFEFESEEDLTMFLLS